MHGQSFGEVWRRWFGAESTGRRRAIIAMPIVMLSMLLWATILFWIFGEASLLIMGAALVGIGAFARHWLVLLTAYVSAVLSWWAVEIGAFLWLGSNEWEERNAEHFPGSAPAVEKLLGQLLEYVVFGSFIVLPLVGVGIMIGVGIEHVRKGRSSHGMVGA